MPLQDVIWACFDMAVKALLYVMPWLKLQVSLSVIEFKSEELHPACVMREKNNKLFCWCSWDEVIGCKKLDTSGSHLWLCDQAC